MVPARCAEKAVTGVAQRTILLVALRPLTHFLGQLPLAGVFMNAIMPWVMESCGWSRYRPAASITTKKPEPSSGASRRRYRLLESTGVTDVVGGFFAFLGHLLSSHTADQPAEDAF